MYWLFDEMICKDCRFNNSTEHETVCTIDKHLKKDTKIVVLFGLVPEKCGYKEATELKFSKKYLMKDFKSDREINDFLAKELVTKKMYRVNDYAKPSYSVFNNKIYIDTIYDPVSNISSFRGVVTDNEGFVLKFLDECSTTKEAFDIAHKYIIDTYTSTMKLREEVKLLYGFSD
jgi:hypothetical protein